MDAIEKTKAECRDGFAACWELAMDATASIELILWLKENYAALCTATRWGIPGVPSEFKWDLDEHSEKLPYFEESLWSNPNMPVEELESEFENTDDTQLIEAILANPSCPKELVVLASQIQFDDREWVEEVTEEEVEDLRESAREMLG